MKKKDDFDIIHEDDDIVVISKHAGMLTIPDRYNKALPNIYRILNDKFGSIYTVHRLDRDTSGVMVFAKNADAHRNLNMQFDNQEVGKFYHLVLAGVVNKDEMKIDIPIAADPSKPGLSYPSARGKDSLTILKVLKRFRSSTLVECELVTGRHHQLRVHCATIGNPLLIDPEYAGTNEVFLSSFKRKFKLGKRQEEKPIISRLTMHSRSITFNHPDGTGKLTFEAEYPKDFAALLQSLSKYSALPEYYRKSEDEEGEEES
jgi:23S rRNA pseudouridine1911/1915/1917 synthase